MIKTIVKLDGSEEDFQPSKLSLWVKWAAKQLPVSVEFGTIIAEVVNAAHDKITSQELQKLLIDTTVTKNSWSHSLMAGRLFAPYLHKKIFPEGIPSLKEQIDNMVNIGLMRRMEYNNKELDIINDIMVHDIDKSYPHFRSDYIYQKYALKNVLTGQRYETPQFTYMRLALAIAEGRNEEDRIDLISRLYKYFNEGVTSSPTPNLIHLGTNSFGLASCCLITAGDTAESIGAAIAAAYSMTHANAGVGLGYDVRSIGESVRSGVVEHQGKTNYFRAARGVIQANLKGGRGGALNNSWSVYDAEAQSLIPLNNPLTPEQARIAGVDYTVNINSAFLERVAKNEQILSFSVKSAPDLYASLTDHDCDRFEELYAKYQADPNFPKRYMSARQIFSDIIDARFNTGRYYMLNLTEVNRHNSTVDPVRNTNLCVEIQEHTEPYDNAGELWSEGPIGHITVDLGENNELSSFDYFEPVRKVGEWFNRSMHELQPGDKFRFVDKSVGNDADPGIYDGIYELHKVVSVRPEPEIALCNLSAVNGVAYRDGEYIDLTDEEYEEACYLGLEQIYYTIHCTEYPLPHVTYTSTQRNNAGLGIMGFAHWFARRRRDYVEARMEEGISRSVAMDEFSFESELGRNAIHQYYERHSYLTIKAAVRHTREKGLAPWAHRSRWSRGWLPIDTYNRNVDTIHTAELKYDWEGLREEIRELGGLTFTGLMAMMPGESSSKALGTTGSIYPIRYVSYMKTDSNGQIDFQAPEGDTLGEYYELAYELSPRAHIHNYALCQKFIDQGISADEFRNLVKDSNISSTQEIADKLYSFWLGVSSWYYNNTATSTDRKLEDGTIESIVVEQESTGGAKCTGGACSL